MTIISDRYRDDVIKNKYGKTHDIIKRIGTEVDLRNLKENEFVCCGDGKTFYYLLTEKI